MLRLCRKCLGIAAGHRVWGYFTHTTSCYGSLVLYVRSSWEWGRMSVLLRRAWERASSRPLVWLTWVIAIDAVFAMIGVILGGKFNLTALLAAGPLLACARVGGRATAIISLYALALCAIVGAITG